MDQMTFGLDLLHKRSRKEVFLDEMNRHVPWAALVALIQARVQRAHEALGGPPPFSIGSKLRIYCLQLHWNLSDPAMEEELHEWPQSCVVSSVSKMRPACPTKAPACDIVTC